MKSIKEIFFFIYRVNDGFLINVARKRAKRSSKAEFCDYRKTRDMLISLFRARTVPNLKALTWKMASGMTKMQKSVIASVCAYLMSSKAHYLYHELSTVDE